MDCTLSDILRVAFVEVFDVIDPAVSEALEEAKAFDKFVGILRANDVLLDADLGQMTCPINVDETKMTLIITIFSQTLLNIKINRSVYGPHLAMTQ